MKLRNKKSGEILETAHSATVIKDKFRIYDEITDKYYTYNTLAELNEEWEDYEESTGYFYIRDGGNIDHNLYGKSIIKRHQEIGNYFETKEEAEKAVEKLKAWKRLKDMKIKYQLDFVRNSITFTYQIENTLIDVLDAERQIFTDLKLLFGGEE